MAVQDKDTLQAQKDALLASGKAGGILASDHRAALGDTIDSVVTLNTEYTDGDATPPRVMVNSAGGTYVSKVQTSEAAAPKVCGETQVDVPDSPSWSEVTDTNGQIVLRKRYTLDKGKDGVLSPLQVYFPRVSQADPYRTVIAITTQGGGTTTEFLPTTKGGFVNWQTLKATGQIARQGTVIDIYTTVLNSGTESQDSIDYIYGGQTLADLNAGEITRNPERTKLRFSTQDSGAVDVTAKLAAIANGSRFNIQVDANNREEYAVTNISDVQPTYYEFDVLNTLTLGNINDGNAITADITNVTTPVATYDTLPDRLIGTQPDWATVEAFITSNGVETQVDDDLPIRLTFTEVCFSGDWTQIGQLGAFPSLPPEPQRYEQVVYGSYVNQLPTEDNEPITILFETENPYRPGAGLCIVDSNGELRPQVYGQIYGTIDLTFDRTGSGQGEEIYFWLEYFFPASLGGPDDWIRFGQPQRGLATVSNPIQIERAFELVNAEVGDRYRFRFATSDATGEGIGLYVTTPTVNIPAPAVGIPTDIPSAELNIRVLNTGQPSS